MHIARLIVQPVEQSFEYRLLLVVTLHYYVHLRYTPLVDINHSDHNQPLDSLTRSKHFEDISSTSRDHID